MRKNMGTADGKRHAYIYKNCVDCWSDSYDTDHSNMLYYLLFQNLPERVKQINDQYCRYRVTKRILRTRKNFQYERCNLGNYHLNSLGRSFQGRKRVAMLKQSLAILQQLHGPEHRDESDMKHNLRKNGIYDHDYIERFMYSYLMKCEKCRAEKLIRMPMKQNYFSNIFERIKNIEQNRLLLEPPIAKNDVQELGLDENKCFFDCTKDQYDEEMQALMDLYFHNKVPQDILQDPEKCSLYKAKKRKLKVITCERGTRHLYRQWYDSKQIYKRIPMENQKFELLKKLHGKQHRGVLRMHSILKQTFYSYFDMKRYIQKNIVFCERCKNQVPKVKVQVKNKKRGLVTIQQSQKYQSQQYDELFPDNDSDDDNQEYDKNMINQKTLDLFNKPQRTHASNDYPEQLEYVPVEKEIHKPIQNLQHHDKDLHFYLHSLRIKGWFIVSDNDNSSIIMMSDRMHRKYSTHGDCIKVQEIVKKNSIRAWNMYLLSIQDVKTQKAIAGLALLRNEDFQTFYKFYELLFNINKNVPQSIIFNYETNMDLNTNMSTALQSLTYYTINEKIKRIKYFYSWTPVMQKIAQGVTKQQYQNELIDILQMGRIARTQSQFDKVTHMIRGLVKDKKAYYKFRQYEQKYCLSKMSNKFIGFDMPQFHLFQHVDNVEEKDMTIEYMVAKFIKIQEAQTKCTFDQNTIVPQQLNTLHSLVSQQLYNKLYAIYQQSLNLVSISEEALYEIVIDGLVQYRLVYNVSNKCWQCSCQYIYKYGLPCAHLMTVVEKYRGQIAYYLSSRWYRQ